MCSVILNCWWSDNLHSVNRNQQGQCHWKRIWSAVTSRFFDLHSAGMCHSLVFIQWHARWVMSRVLPTISPCLVNQHVLPAHAQCGEVLHSEASLVGCHTMCDIYTRTWRLRFRLKLSRHRRDLSKNIDDIVILLLGQSIAVRGVGRDYRLIFVIFPSPDPYTVYSRI